MPGRGSDEAQAICMRRAVSRRCRCHVGGTGGSGDRQTADQGHLDVRPYNYASDDFHGHLGFLITTWLTPGMHRFTASVKTTTGQRGQDTVVARVLPAPEPPAELAGTWKRIVPHAGGGPPTGEWRLVFDSVGAWHLDPLGSGVVNQYDVDADVIHNYAPIQMAPFSNGHGGVDRYGAHEIGGTRLPRRRPVWLISLGGVRKRAKGLSRK
jgi:hypothetical protein